MLAVGWPAYVMNRLSVRIDPKMAAVDPRAAAGPVEEAGMLAVRARQRRSVLAVIVPDMIRLRSMPLTRVRDAVRIASWVAALIRVWIAVRIQLEERSEPRTAC